MTVFRAEQRAAFASRSPLMQAKIEPLAVALGGISLHESWMTPRDKMIVAGDHVYMRPSTLMRVTGRDLYTRHTVGSLEAERDRRWAAKRLSTPRHPRVP